MLYASLHNLHFQVYHSIPQEISFKDWYYLSYNNTTAFSVVSQQGSNLFQNLSNVLLIHQFGFRMYHL